MEVFTNGEEKILCPYNSAHHIRKSRMGVHIVKCGIAYRELNPDAEMVTCDFCVQHVVPKPEIQYHHEICSERKKTETWLIQEEGAQSSFAKFPVHKIDIPSDENWDDEESATYKPEEYCKAAPVLRSLNVASAAKRKNFRVVERQRISQLEGVDTDLNREEELSRGRDPAPPADESPVESPRAKLRNPILPEPKKAPTNEVIEEEVPSEISKLTERVKQGRNKAYLPKQRQFVQ